MTTHEALDQTIARPGTCPVAHDFDPLSASQTSNPYPIFARMRKEAPVFFSPRLNMWVVSRYDDVAMVFKDSQRFSSAKLLGIAGGFTPEVQELLSTGHLAYSTPIIYADPPRHTRLRKPLTRAFSARRVANLEPDLRQLTGRLIEQWTSSGQADFMIGFARVYPMLVIFRLIGIPESASDQLARWSTDFLTMLFVPLPPQQQLECARSYLALQQHVYQLLEQRRANPQDDFASALLKAVEEEQADLQMFEVLELLLDLIVAGYVTTSDFLGLCLYNLLSRQEYWKAIQENPALIPAVVEEMLRFDTPGLSLLRVTSEDVELGGVVIPKDAIVYVLESSANHDEDYFSHPEEFNPYRENRHHLAFGRGIHFCIGAPLARLEAQVTLELLSQKLPSLRLISNQEVTYVPNLALRGLQSLLVEWDD